MASIEVVLHLHVQGCGDHPFLVVAANVEIVIGEPMNQGRVSGKGEGDVLIRGGQRVVVRIVQSVWCSLADCSFVRSTALTTRTF